MAERSAQHHLHPASLIATWFGCGHLPVAPGTWGSAAALPCAAVLVTLGGPGLLFAAALLLFPLGVWASARVAELRGESDPGAVVVDEVVGQWLTLLPVAFDLRYYLVGFFFFRLFDVFKPWPANWLDRRVKGGLGIMADDVAAGLYAALVCLALAALTGQSACFPWTC